MADSSGRGAAQAARPSGGTASCETERAATPREPSSLSAGGSEDMLARAVAAARRNAFAQATERFEELLAAEPAQQKAWITYAQMYKRKAQLERDEEALSTARKILQRGLAANPTSGQIAQTWGLTELQRGNVVGCIRLIDRCVQLDPTLAAVLRWRPIREARAAAEAAVARRRRDAGQSAGAGGFATA